jgi:hypothetical protein
MENNEIIKLEGGYKVTFAKTRKGKYLYWIVKRNKCWRSNLEYCRMFTALRGAKRAVNRLSLRKPVIDFATEIPSDSLRRA